MSNTKTTIPFNQRVVITGLGVVAPNGTGINDFSKAIKNGTSGIAFFQELEDLKFSCCIGGRPTVTEAQKRAYFTDLQLRNFNSSGILYGCMAGIDAWKDARLTIDNEAVDYDTGAIFGTGTSGVEKFREAIYKLDDKQVRRLGSTVVVQTMASGISAYLGGMLGLGNQVSTNSSACTTGTEAIFMGYERIKNRQAKRMLVGSCSDYGPYLWGGFDAMRVLTYKFNRRPTEGSRPMSASASGFVPGSGAGALLLESLESALERNATVYAEIVGGAINSGGQRNGGSMTAPNPEAVQRCINQALANSQTRPEEIDLINGHLTATVKDPEEIKNWVTALGRAGDDFPYIQATKSTIGHCLAAAGAIETVASVLQIKEGFIAPNTNCEDLHPEIEKLIPKTKIPMKHVKKSLSCVAKASFGFGDVNACLILKKFNG